MIDVGHSPLLEVLPLSRSGLYKRGSHSGLKENVPHRHYKELWPLRVGVALLEEVCH